MDNQNTDQGNVVRSDEHLLSLLTLLNEREATGFLPSKTPLRILPEPFASLSHACETLPVRYHGTDKDVRPWLSKEFGVGQQAWSNAWHDLDKHTIECLMMQVSLLCHAFRWQSAPTSAENYKISDISLPTGLDELWAALASHLGIPKVGVFYTMVCLNWQLRDRSPGALYQAEHIYDANFELNFPWLQRSAERELRAFILAALGIESRGAAICQQLRKIYQGILDNKTATVADGLQLLAEELSRLSSHFNSYIRNGHMTATGFQTLLQPTMIWLLDHGNGPLEGASGPQSCVMQIVDSVFGVPKTGRIGKTLRSARQYMLPAHRELLTTLDLNSQVLRDFVVQSDDATLVSLYDECLSRLAKWRKSHKSRGALYIQPETVGGGDYASTGMVVELGVDRVAVFEEAMTTHIASTITRRLSTQDSKKNVTGCPFAGR